MSIDRSLDKLASIMAGLNKPAQAEAEGLKPYKVTKTIVVPFANEEDEIVRQDRIIWAEDVEAAQAEFVMTAPKPIISWDVREIKPVGGDS